MKKHGRDCSALGFDEKLNFKKEDSWMAGLLKWN